MDTLSADTDADFNVASSETYNQLRVTLEVKNSDRLLVLADESNSVKVTVFLRWRVGSYERSESNKRNTQVHLTFGDAYFSDYPDPFKQLELPLRWFQTNLQTGLVVEVF